MAIRKEDVLISVEDAELVEIIALGDELPLRPLSKKEINEVNKIETKAYGKFETSETAYRKGMRQQKKTIDSQISTKGVVDLYKQQEAEYQGRLHALYLSMNNKHPDCEEWEKKDIERLKGDAFDEIFEKVQILSGIDIGEDEVENFPEK